MAKLLHTLTFFFLLTVAAMAQNCMPLQEFWGDFTGKAGSREIELSVYRQANGILTGNCRFSGKEKTVYACTGSITACSFTIQLLTRHSSPAGQIEFTYFHNKVNKTDVYNGSFTDSNNNRIPLNIRLNTMVGGTLYQRYNELFGTTAAVEAFAEKIKNAFIANDKKWLAANCQYPLAVYNQSKKPLMIQNAREFESRYNVIFTAAYLNKFKNIKCHNMFSTHVGAMLGKGEVKINHTRNSVKDNYTYCISTIEIFMY